MSVPKNLINGQIRTLTSPVRFIMVVVHANTPEDVVVMSYALPQNIILGMDAINNNHELNNHISTLVKHEHCEHALVVLNADDDYWQASRCVRMYRRNMSCDIDELTVDFMKARNIGIYDKFVISRLKKDELDGMIVIIQRSLLAMYDFFSDRRYQPYHF